MSYQEKESMNILPICGEMTLKTSTKLPMDFSKPP